MLYANYTSIKKKRIIKDYIYGGVCKKTKLYSFKIAPSGGQSNTVLPGKGSSEPRRRQASGGSWETGGVGSPGIRSPRTQFSCFPFSVMTLPCGPALTGSGDRVAVFLSRTTAVRTRWPPGSVPWMLSQTLGPALCHRKRNLQRSKERIPAVVVWLLNF